MEKFYPRISWKICAEEMICPGAYYKCFYYNYCIHSRMLCDGIKHCILGDDEENCHSSLLQQQKKNKQKNKVIN